MRIACYGLLASLIVVQFGCAEPEGNDMLSLAEENGVQLNDVGIARFPTPDGWASNRSNHDTAVILIRSDANRKYLTQMVSIDIGTPVSPDVKASADGFAEQYSGNVSRLPYQIDGETAYRVSIPANYEQLLPRECIVVHHDGKVCFLIAGSKSKDPIWSVLSVIAQSWKWR